MSAPRYPSYTHVMMHRLHTRWFKIVLATRPLTRKRFSVSAPSPSYDRLSERGTSTIAACVASWCATPAPTTASPCREWASWRRAGSATGAFTGRTRPGRYNSVRVDATACCVRLAEVLYLETNLKKQNVCGKGCARQIAKREKKKFAFFVWRCVLRRRWRQDDDESGEQFSRVWPTSHISVKPAQPTAPALLLSTL